MAKADDEEAADRTCKEINEKFGSLDILINNAVPTCWWKQWMLIWELLKKHGQ